MSTEVTGNFEDKYHSRNLISKFLVNNYLHTFRATLETLTEKPIHKICEVGCAEGELLKITHSVFPGATLSATDISADEIEKAKSNCKPLQVNYSIQNAEQLTEYSDATFDLVICCEVLEHLSNPCQGLSELCRISSKYILVSVPHEPIWRMLNMVRGKYFSACGNTPGHIQHWNKKKFIQFIPSQPGLKIVSQIYPFPWQLLLLERVHV